MPSSPIRSFAVLATVALCLAACSESAKAPAPAATASTTGAPQSEQDKTLYSIGVILSRNLQSFEFSAAEIDQVTKGLKEGLLEKKSVEEAQAYVPKIQELQKEREGAAAKKEKEAGSAYLAKAATEAGATKTASGIVIKTVKEGTGASPKATDEVKVHYEGKFVDGKVFDSSIARNEPATFGLSQVIPCWTEAVQTMKVGGKAQVVCPSELAYGDEGRPPQMRGGATLVFDVELLDIVKAQAATQPPVAPKSKPAG